MADDMPRLLDAIARVQTQPAHAEEEEVMEALELGPREHGTGDPQQVSVEEESVPAASVAQAPVASRPPPPPAAPAPHAPLLSPISSPAETLELESARLEEDTEVTSAQDFALLEAEQERIAHVQALMMRVLLCVCVCVCVCVWI